MSHPSFALHAATAPAPDRQHSIWRRMWDGMIAVHQAEADRHVEEILGEWTLEQLHEMEHLRPSDGHHE